MEKRRLGKSDIEVAPICFGGNVFGWTIDEPTSFEVLNGFSNKGFNFIDTADSYSNWAPGNKGGESETIIGKWMKDRKNRQQVIIATKLGSDLGNGKKGLSRSYIFAQVEESLQRLQTDYIDLYQAHYDDPSTPIDETLEAFDELVKQGKVRIIGASNFTPERFASSLQVSKEKKIASYQTLQPLYNLYSRDEFEKELQPLCVGNDVSVIPYFSLASGFLTGKYRSEEDLQKSKRGQGIKKYLNNRGFRILKALDELAASYNATPASISLSWLLAQPAVTAPIASVTNNLQLEDFVKAVQIKLDDSATSILNDASAS